MTAITLPPLIVGGDDVNAITPRRSPAAARPNLFAAKLQLRVTAELNVEDDADDIIQVHSATSPITHDTSTHAEDVAATLPLAPSALCDRRRSFEVRGGTFRTGEFELGPAGVTFVDSIVARARQRQIKLRASPLGTSTERSVSALDMSADSLEVMGELGRGAGGKVMKAVHKASLNIVALKIIDVNDKTKRAQLSKELKVLSALKHKHIVTFHGAFYEETVSHANIGLEYMNRGSMQTIIHSCGALPEIVCACIIKQVLLGLAYLHDDRKLHCDIKPGNMLVSYNALVKVSDFGLLSELASETAVCSHHVGTTIYMSPERLQSKDYYYPADVWSVGMSLLTMATGKYPLSVGDGFWDLLSQLDSHLPPPALPADTPLVKFSAPMRDFVDACLHLDPARRWTISALLKHEWIECAYDREESLAHWPAKLCMAEPDDAVMSAQTAARLEKCRVWSERHKINALHGGRSTATVPVAAAVTLKHRRKKCVTEFIPVGLDALKREMINQTTESPSRLRLRGRGSSTLNEESGEEKQQILPIATPTNASRPASATPITHALSHARRMSHSRRNSNTVITAVNMSAPTAIDEEKSCDVTARPKMLTLHSSSANGPPNSAASRTPNSRGIGAFSLVSSPLRPLPASSPLPSIPQATAVSEHDFTVGSIANKPVRALTLSHRRSASQSNGPALSLPKSPTTARPMSPTVLPPLLHSPRARPIDDELSPKQWPPTLTSKSNSLEPLTLPVRTDNDERIVLTALISPTGATVTVRRPHKRSTSIALTEARLQSERPNSARSDVIGSNSSEMADLRRILDIMMETFKRRESVEVQRAIQLGTAHTQCLQIQTTVDKNGGVTVSMSVGIAVVSEVSDDTSPSSSSAQSSPVSSPSAVCHSAFALKFDELCDLVEDELILIADHIGMPLKTVYVTFREMQATNTSNRTPRVTVDLANV